jgi:hypothetical protein
VDGTKRPAAIEVKRHHDSNAEGQQPRGDGIGFERMHEQKQKPGVHDESDGAHRAKAQKKGHFPDRLRLRRAERYPIR